MKRCKRFLAVLLTMACMMTMSVSAFAAEPVTAPVGNNDTALPTSVSPRSVYGYAAKYTNSSIGSFYIDTTGSSTSRGGFTIESYSFSSSTVKIAITLYRPDGTQAVNTTLTGNQKIENLSFSNAPAGQYRVYYHVYGDAKGWLGGWVYSK